jgi:hypothetical protein
MKKIKLFEILKNFDIKDFSEFQSYLDSSFLNERKNLTGFYKTIISKKNLILSGSHNEIIELLRKQFKYTYKTISHYLSYLCKAVVRYYNIKAMQSDEIINNIMLNEYLLKIGNMSVLSYNIGLTDKLISETKTFDEMQYLYSHLHNDIKITYLLSCGNFWKKSNSDLREKLYLESAEDLMLFNIQTNVIYFANLVSKNISSGNENSINYYFDIQGLFEIYENFLIKSPNEKKKINFMFYKLLFNTFSNLMDERHFQKYKKYFVQNASFLDISILQIHYNFLINYCSVKIRTENSSNYILQSFELERIYIDNDYYKNESCRFLSTSLFQNYVIDCFGYKMYDEILNFVERNAIKLNPDDTNYMVNFAMAHYYFGTCDFKSALKCINNNKPVSNIYKYHLMCLELKIYFEITFSKHKFQSDIDAKISDNIIDITSKSLKADSYLTGIDRERMLKMIRYYKKIYLLAGKLGIDENVIDELEFIRIKIEEDEEFTMKKWLLDKTDNILGEYRRTNYPKDYKSGKINDGTGF